MDKDTLFHGQQKMLIDAWKFSDNNMVQCLSPSPTEDSHIFVTNWPSIPKLGKVMDKDTLFHGKQKMLIDV